LVVDVKFKVLEGFEWLSEDVELVDGDE